ncbi:TetR/AcrR family transcriptional regulator [Sphingomonas sp. 3-13AW]|jgi:AcrR family transcriptional regulator|uniref:TetR/AcrR family transcriptional regulator n=1 Tax=Sphingomonas sp. 3-13AW TaxID=3050450 RepID=UPI003BB53F8C
MAAAIRIIAQQGLGASTASIGKAAGVSNGALFTYFETKADLLNQLYVELKHRMAAMTTVDLPEGDPREQLQHVWYGLLRWADEQRLERQALAQLSVSKDLTDPSRNIASEPFAHVEALLDRCRIGGPMHNASLTFVGALVMAMADATINSIADDPAAAERHAAIGFDAMWRAIT